MTDRAVRNIWVGEVPWEQDEGDIANVFSLRQARKMPQLEWRVPCAIQDLWGALDRRQSSSINKFLRVIGRLMKQAQRTTRANAPYLQEDLTEYSVSLFPEHGREDNGDAVKGRLNVDGFFVTIVQRKKLALALTSSSELLLS